MKIVTDTASLFAPCQGEEMGMTVIPVCVSINNSSYQDYTQISTEEFLKLLEEGAIPSSSQPAVGDVLEILESTDEEILLLTIGDGLSGAYQTAMSARNMAENPERVHVVDSKTLAGPLRYMAKKAVALKQQGLDALKIIEALQCSIESSVSFVIPEDFEFLRRSGRLTTITAKIGGTLKLLPVLTQTKDKTRITPIGVKRSWDSAVETVLQRMQQLNVGAGHLISVCYANTPQKAAGILETVKQRFAAAETELLELSPALITHGGPGCIVIQAVLK